MSIIDYKENAKPIYLQIVDRMCDDITSGEYHDNGRIPSVRLSATDFKVNANTMMRAYEYMWQRGIIQNQRGIGYFITPDAKDLIHRMREETFFSDEIEYFFDRLKNMAISPEKLRTLYDNFLAKKEGTKNRK